MFAIINAQLFDGIELKSGNDWSIVVDDKGIICEVGKTLAIPDRYSVFDACGKFVMPGLIDMHTHISNTSMFTRPKFAGRTETYDYAESREGFLRWGVTTVRSCGDRTEDILSFRKDGESAAALPRPRIVACGPMFQATGGHPWATIMGKNRETGEKACVFVDESTDVETELGKLADTPVDFIKVMYSDLNKFNYNAPLPQITKEQLCAIVAAAHSRGLKVAVHIDGAKGMTDALDAGVDFIEHLIGAGAPDSDYSDELIDRIASSQVVITPTMVSLPPFDNKSGRPAVWPKLKELVLKLYNRKAAIALGCDCPIAFVPAGESIHGEMAHFADIGVPADKVFAMATHGNAVYLGLENEVGQIAEGRYADILVLNSNPAEAINNSKDIYIVFKSGRVVYQAGN